MLTRALLTFLLLVTAAAAQEAPPPVPFHMPTPEGWRTETIPFPLGFAPELAFEGLEELRFAPGMFTANSEDFWTYAFVWWIAEPDPLAPADLAADLETYFAGLIQAVGESRELKVDDVLHEVTLTSAPDGDLDMVGTAHTFDPFVTAAPVRLNVRVKQFACPDAERRVVWFELSPQPFDHAVWGVLGDMRQAFRCAK